MTDDILERMDAWLAKARLPPPTLTESDDQNAEHIRSCLSGAFSRAIGVYRMAEGVYLAAIYGDLIKASGLRFVETAARGRAGGYHEDGSERVGKAPFQVLVGGPDAARNAANRVAKPLGEGWRVEVDSFGVTDELRGMVFFRVERV